MTACLLLVPSGLALLVLGILSSEPNSDTGEKVPTGSMAALLTVGAALVLMCIPVVYLFARNRAVAGAFVTVVGLGVAILTLYAS